MIYSILAKFLIVNLDLIHKYSLAIFTSKIPGGILFLGMLEWASKKGLFKRQSLERVIMTTGNLAEVRDGEEMSGTRAKMGMGKVVIPSIAKQIETLLEEEFHDKGLGMNKEEFVKWCEKVGIESRGVLIVPNVPIRHLGKTKSTSIAYPDGQLKNRLGHELKVPVYGLKGLDLGIINMGRPLCSSPREEVVKVKGGNKKVMIQPRPLTLTELVVVLLYNQDSPAKYFGAGATMNGGIQRSPIATIDQGRIIIDDCVALVDAVSNLAWPSYTTLVSTAPAVKVK